MKQTEIIRWPNWPNFETLFGGWGAYHVREEDNHVCVDVDLPGAKREDISLSAQDGGIQIIASRNDDGSDKIRRHIPLPSINSDSLQASLENGVLEIRAERGSPKTEIEIKS